MDYSTGALRWEGALSGVGEGWGFLLFMPRKSKRYHGRGDLHSITFSCYERRVWRPSEVK